MPQSKKPRKRYQPRDYRAEAAQLRSEALQAGESQSAEVHTEPPAPPQPHQPASPRAPRGRGRYLVPVAAGGAIIGGGAFLAHRARRRSTVNKGLIDPLSGDRVVIEKRYIEDEVDAQSRGVLVAKAGIPKRAALLMRAGQGATLAGRGARAAGRGVATAARQPGQVLSGFLDTGLEGRIARSQHALRDGKMGTARRTGSVLQASGAGALGMYGLGSLNGRFAEQEKQAEKRRAARAKARAGTASKRDDETKLTHIGGRRGGRLPVSTVHTSGLPVQSASFSQGRPWERSGTSHANKLTHVHTKVKHHPRGTLFQLKRKPRSVSGSSVGKCFSETGANGRRLTAV